MSNKIVVIGSINEDISLGVDEIVSSGKTIFSSSHAIHNGGKGANQAITAARMNSKVNFIGAVGNDASGRRILTDLQVEGINVDGIKYVKEQTGFAVIQIDNQGSNAIIVHKGANYTITKDDIDKNEMLIRESQYCLLQFEIPMDVIHYAIEKCYEWGVKVILNPAPFVDNFDRDLLSKVHCFVPNEHEFMDMMHHENVDEYNVGEYAEKFYKKYKTNIIITLGKAGSYYHGVEGSFLQTAKVVRAVDTTAAGDSYIGALVSNLIETQSFKKAMAFATEVSAITVTREGAQPSIPKYEEL